MHITEAVNEHDSPVKWMLRIKEKVVIRSKIRKLSTQQLVEIPPLTDQLKTQHILLEKK